ncbi:hypothetical protein TKK_0002427 [Trichogramma kaykai]|uniref:NADH dehydrogenase [ubiquinone] 1 alpha subcomplex assembly factor 2 n=1 Tax=Trichogramma kaykai TaxID=54128 RepID=A0ABD2VXB9_9HYME
MAGKERRLMHIIFKHFFRSITPKIPKHNLVGEDYMGTKYYEVTNLKESIHKKSNRYFVPKEKNNFEQDLPAEWEAWLRKRRTDPPTEAEVMENYEMILTKRQNAAELEITYQKEEGLQSHDPNAKPLDQHASINFPTYDEYKQFGRDYKPNWKKNKS